MLFEKVFALNFYGKLNWYGGQFRGDKLFGWVAREDDYNLRGVIGEYFCKNGDFKLIIDIEVEDNRKIKSLVLNFLKIIEVKDIQCKEMKIKLEEIFVLLNKLMYENKVMMQSYNEGIYYEYDLFLWLYFIFFSISFVCIIKQLF